MRYNGFIQENLLNKVTLIIEEKEIPNTYDTHRYFSKHYQHWNISVLFNVSFTPNSPINEIQLIMKKH